MQVIHQILLHNGANNQKEKKQERYEATNGPLLVIYTFQMGYLSLHPITAQAINYESNYIYNTLPDLFFSSTVEQERDAKRQKEGDWWGSKLHCSKGIDHDCKQLSMWFQYIRYLNSLFKYRSGRRIQVISHQKIRGSNGEEKNCRKNYMKYIRSTN